MKILLPLLMLMTIVVGGMLYSGSKKVENGNHADMLQLGNFAYQQQRYDDAIQWYTKAALQGVAEAQYQLSKMYKQGQGTDKDEVLALNWIKKAANQGIPKAELAYADMLASGQGLEHPDAKMAHHWYTKAAEHGQPEAILKLAQIYFSNFSNSSKPEDLYIALHWALKAKNNPASKAQVQPLYTNIKNTILSQAQAGDTEAQFQAAQMYLPPLSATPDTKQAQAWLQKAAMQGHLEAQYQLGILIAQTQGLHSPQAAQWLADAAKQGHAQAGQALTPLLAHNQAPEHTHQAWKWLYFGLRHNNPKTLYNLAVSLHHGSIGLPQTDYNFTRWLSYAAKHDVTPAQNDAAVLYISQEKANKQAIDWLKTAAQAGDPYAQFNLGLLLARGKIFATNHEKALYWWKQAESKGNQHAQMMLGLLYHLGHGVARDEQKAIHWYEKASQHGNNDALFNLAMIHYHGHGTEQNYNASAFYLETLAKQGDAQAQNIYAFMFLEGKGVSYSPAAAAVWFQQAAKAGNTQAMFNLANLYRSGKGVQQNDEQALYWYRKAADQGYAPAQNAMGYLYAAGRGGQKDITQAELWLRLAADKGLDIAKKNLASLQDHASFSLAAIQVDTSIRSHVLTDGNIDLTIWLQTHHQPIL